MKHLPFLLALLAIGCDGGDKDDTGDICIDAPTVTYDSFVEGFISETCLGCHSTELSGFDRNGAPATVNFNTEDDVIELSDRILARATGANPTMPPAGGTDADDRFLLEVYLSCELP